MQANSDQPSRLRRTVNDLVLAEMLLFQATIESAAAIGDGIGELKDQLAGAESRDNAWDSISHLLRQTREEAVEPYTSRFKYLRQMIDSDA